MRYTIISVLSSVLILGGCSNADNPNEDESSLETPKNINSTIDIPKRANLELEKEVRKTQQKLRQMAINDQTIRKNLKNLRNRRKEDISVSEEYKALLKSMKQQDALHAGKLEEYLDQYGWIDPQRFGKQASRDAWLITQHMVHDKGTFQKRVLSQLVPKKNISGAQYALLQDRISVIFDKEPQYYGTQGRCKHDGDWVPSTIYNKKDINQRRLSLGLGNFEDYHKRMDVNCSN